MTEHTPVPWSVPHFAQPDVNCECKWVLCDSYMGAIAAIYCSGKGDNWKAHGDNPKFQEAVANARLIAAAPDLLAACQILIKGLPIYNRDAWPELAAGVDGIRAAIAKAQGKQP